MSNKLIYCSVVCNSVASTHFSEGDSARNGWSCPDASHMGVDCRPQGAVGVWFGPEIGFPLGEWSVMSSPVLVLLVLGSAKGDDVSFGEELIHSQGVSSQYFNCACGGYAFATTIIKQKWAALTVSVRFNSDFLC